MVGIYDCFGYVVGYDVSFEERYKLLPFDGSIEVGAGYEKDRS